jgi:hypothetical protein
MRRSSGAVVLKVSVGMGNTVIPGSGTSSMQAEAGAEKSCGTPQPSASSVVKLRCLGSDPMLLVFEKLDSMTSAEVDELLALRG